MLKRLKPAKILQRLKSVRVILTIGLFLSIAFAAYSMHYKIRYWGFSASPKQVADVWTVEAHVSFKPVKNSPITVSISRPVAAGGFKILNETVVANGYDIEEKDDRIVVSAKPKKKDQSIYYRVLLFDNVDSQGQTPDAPPQKVQKPVLDEGMKAVTEQLLELAKEQEGDSVQQIIALFNQTPMEQIVTSFLPTRRTEKDTAMAVIDLLALKGISSRIIRGVKLEDKKKTFTPDVMIEAYYKKAWRIYNITTGKEGVPSNFIIFQRGGNSLVDVSGGVDSVTRFSVMKSISSSFKMAGHRARLTDNQFWFDYSVYSLPLNHQSALKWLTIFPLAILVVVLMRNVVGIPTMGTFTPMLISTALVQTGFWAGLLCFALIITLGLALRSLLSKFNLLSVPRISAVVVFVILIIQFLAIIGYQWRWDVASSALFFPIIIMAWVIERASITWEEEGAKNAMREIIYSVLVAIITYFVIVNETIRHVMFAFNELNLVLLFIIMLLGTYTGYRLTELTRFAPLVRKGSK